MNSAVFCKEGSKCFTCSADGAAKMWDVETGQCLQSFVCGDNVTSVALSDDETLMMTTCESGHLLLWDVKAGSWQTLAELDRDELLSACFVGERKMFMRASGYDPLAQLWDAAIFPKGRIVFGHDEFVSFGELFHERFALTIGRSRSTAAKLWSAETEALVQTFAVPGAAMTSASLSHDGACVLTASTDARARLWDVATGKCLLLLEGHAGTLRSARFPHP